ncbi:hypothetical protein AHF37_01948 [Paragonimus kellicotti]|nr:hypothetical protein AHF37_01948 [Paragonimus kellicotti]
MLRTHCTHVYCLSCSHSFGVAREHSMNIYGNMTGGADTYYGTLFSNFSYGMGENRNPNSPTNPDATSATAAAAAVAAAMAAVTGGGNGGTDWANMTGSYPPLNSNTLVGQSHQANSLNELAPPCSADDASSYATRMLAALAAAASVVYPVHPQQLPPHSNSLPATQSFMSNPSQADFAAMYYRSPPRQPTAMRSILNTGQYSNDSQFQTPVATLPGWPYTAPSNMYNSTSSTSGAGMTTVVDGWSTSTGQPSVVVQQDTSGLSLTHGQYGSNSADDGVVVGLQKTSAAAYYTPPHMRESLTMNYNRVVSGGLTDEQAASSYAVSQASAELGDRPGFLSSTSAPHLINGHLVNGQPNLMDPFLSLHQQKHDHTHSSTLKDYPQREHQRLMDEFSRLSVGDYTHTDHCNTSPCVTSGQMPVDGKSTTVGPHWSDTPAVFNSDRSATEHRSKAGGLVRPDTTVPQSALSAVHQPMTTVGRGIVGDAPRAKTWANIAGQPPRGSAAVLVGSTTGWSAKRLPGPVVAPTGSRAPAPGNSVVPISAKSTPPATVSANGMIKSELQSSGNQTFRVDASNTINSSKTMGNAGFEESMHQLQRESEALYQRLAKSINPSTFDTNVEKARFFVIKSFSEDDIHRSIKYAVWCSTELGNKKLDAAFVAANNQYPIYLFYSVNGSGHFCGMAEMTSRVDYDTRVRVWAQDKWQGAFSVRWIFVKDVPNTALRHIRVETNDNKPVTHSRDTTELPLERGRQVMEVLANYSHTLSIFDDFVYYEQRERQDGYRRKDASNRRG